MLGFSTIALLLRHIGDIVGSALVINIWFFSSTAIMMLALGVTISAPIKSAVPAIWPILALATVATATNVFTVKALQLAPNAGYVIGIETAKAAVVLIVASIFLKESISFANAIGVALCLAGVILIVWE